MAGFRYSIVAGAVGFLGGLLYKDKSPKKFEVSAATSVPGESLPMEIDEAGDRVMRTVQFGFPGHDTIRSRKSFVLSYDRRNRIPHWVLEHLTSSHIKYNASVSRRNVEFFKDNSIHPYFQSTNEDYLPTEYDRGHLAAAGNHRSSQEFLSDTFVLSNMAPQVGKGFNRDAWNNLEKHVRHIVKNYKNVYVCTGPLYLPRREADGKKYVKYEVIGPNNVAVPTHFFKVVVCETENQEYDIESYVMPNTVIDNNTPLRAFLVPKDRIEKAAGLLLFDKLSHVKFRSINGQRTDAVEL